MWTETKHGLYKQFVFADFHHAWAFMERSSAVINRLGHHPRWQNEWNVVEFWLSTQEAQHAITEKDWALASALDQLLEAPVAGVAVSVNVEKNTTYITEVQLYTDGGSRGNPGPSASGFVVLDMGGKVLHREGKYLGITTNNQAEYQALKLGLEKVLHTFQSQTVHVYMDSQLVVNQMKRIFKVRNRDLWPIHDSVVSLLPKFKRVTFDHIPRELNKLADAEVNKCLDTQAQNPPRPTE